MEEPTKRRIHSLRVQNVLQVEDVYIKFGPHGMTVLAGENDVGKSSVLHAVALLFDWKSGSKKVAQPILRKGKKKGITEVDLGDGLIVSRKYTEQKTTLTVTRGGIDVKAPQSFIETIRPPSLIDPLEFSAMAPAARRRLMIEIGGLGDKLDGIESRIKAAEDERLDEAHQKLKAIYGKRPDKRHQEKHH